MELQKNKIKLWYGITLIYCCYSSVHYVHMYVLCINMTTYFFVLCDAGKFMVLRDRPKIMTYIHFQQFEILVFCAVET